MRRYLIAISAAAGLMAFGGAVAHAMLPSGRGGLQPPGTGVLASPVIGTPHFPAGVGKPVEQVRQLVRCGRTMYAVGSFTRVLQRRVVYERQNVFSFRASAPFTMTSWAPDVDGTVNSITFNGGNCQDAFLGGAFTSVNRTRVENLAKVSTSTGRVVRGFAHKASNEVETLLGTGGRILVGGFYKSINGSSADPYMTALNPTTGKDDGFLHLQISGTYEFPGVAGNRTRVYNQQLSHDGRLDLVEGDFTSVGGLPRRQIFMLNISGKAAQLTGWTSPYFGRNCARVEPFYIRAASWSPDDSTVYTAATGFHAYGRPPQKFPQKGLCDAAAAFPATQTSVQPFWINHTGCDSLYSTAADASTAYFGGHERWSMNPDGCNREGRDAYPAPGMEGLSPASGHLYINAAGTAGYYSRARGLGADDMLLTSAGLWIASDNKFDSQVCGDVKSLAGICFLPYARRRRRRESHSPAGAAAGNGSGCRGGPLHLALRDRGGSWGDLSWHQIAINQRGQRSSDRGGDEEQPHLRERLAAHDDCGPQTARRVHRGTRQRDSDQMDHGQRQPDGQSGGAG